MAALLLARRLLSRVWLHRPSVWVVSALLVLAACSSVQNPAAPDLSGNPTPSSVVPRFSHIIVIVMENKEYGQIIGSTDAPYINGLATTYAIATNYVAVAHPSLPNYMALTGGATVFEDNCTSCTVDAPNIADEIEASGRRWKAYLEDMRGPCSADAAGAYVVHHNPFLYYLDIVKNRRRCQASVVPLSELATDLRSGQLPDFVWITPNNCHNMHDCNIAVGDGWLASIVPSLIGSPTFANAVLFVTWDEGGSDTGGGGHVVTIVVSPTGIPAFRSATSHSHFGLLRTIEDAWGLVPLGHSAYASAMAEFWP
jgi:hypothetical protein